MEPIHPLSASLTDRVLELALSIQQIPSPTFQEEKRAAFVRDRFQAEGLAEVSIDPIGNVYARLPGRGTSHPLVVTAHMDTVFPMPTSLYAKREPERIAAPGIGDNSLGVAGLFGLVWALEQANIPSLPGDVWLVANVGEEGLGDLCGMKAVVDRFGDRPAAYLVLEGMSLGRIYHRGLGVQRYRITTHTPGGHSWVDYGRPSAIHELALLITRLNALVLPEKPRTTLNVGIIQGGTTVNTVAAEAHLELDLRSEGVDELAMLIDQVEQLVDDSTRKDVEVSAEIIGQRPAGEIDSGHPLVQLALDCMREQGLQPVLSIGSTDANIPLSRGLPAICIGLTTGGGTHTTGEYILTQPLRQGLAQLVEVVTGAFKLT
jgi:acetylornithine deacetylase/succinyl-diaminopimelate desuccinylase-like protein